MAFLDADLVDALGLTGDEPVRHAATSGYGTPRGEARTALVVTDRAAYLAECPPDGDWAIRRHDRAALTGLEVDARGIGEATVALVAGERVLDTLKVARLDRSDFADAAPVLAAAPAARPDDAPSGPLPILVPIDDDVAQAEAPAPPPADEPIVLEPLPPDAEPEPTPEPVAAPESDWARVGPARERTATCRVRATPNPARPGDTVTITCDLDWPAARRARGVRFAFLGHEATRITVKRGKHSHTYREEDVVVAHEETLWGREPAGTLSNLAGGVVALFGGGDFPTLEPGTYRAVRRIAIPRDAPATWHGSHAEVAYTARVSVDLPGAFDVTGHETLAVCATAARFPGAHAHWPGDDRGLLDRLRPDMTLDVSLDPFAPVPRGGLTGTVTLANRSAKRIRGIRLALESREHARAGGYSRDSSDTAASWTLPVAGEMTETVPFRLRLPATFGPYRGRHSEVTYDLVVSADVALGLDVSTRIALG